VKAPESLTIPWRFGDRVEDADAWLRSPEILHVFVDFWSPDTPAAQWHRIMTVTTAWLEKHARDSRLGGVWPALFIVPNGTRAEVEASITSQLEVSWRLLIRYATLLPPNYEPADL